MPARQVFPASASVDPRDAAGLEVECRGRVAQLMPETTVRFPGGPLAVGSSCDYRTTGCRLRNIELPTVNSALRIGYRLDDEWWWWWALLCGAGQLQDVLIGEAEPSTVGFWCGDVSRRVLRLTLDEDHLHRLVADEAAQHGAVAG
jgi:hypothetical protein